MNKVLLVVVLLVGLVNCYTDSEYKDAFVKWIQARQKTYAAADFQQRFEFFKSNMDFVKTWNEDPTHTHTVGLNDFADMSNEEYRRVYLGTHFDATERLANAKPMVTLSSPMGDNVNWAAAGAVTPVKNQGQCGSCWSFSTTGSVETLNYIYTKNLNSLSEQNLMDCSTSYGNNGCNGGLMDNAFRYIIANNGIDLEADYPYEAAQGSCRFQAQYTGASIKNYADVNAGDENDLVNHINTQTVSVAIDASHQSFQLYTSGIYSEPACSTSALDHGVLAIGYGSDNGDYYIVKNSWGTSWGLSGYFWMARNAGNMCGIASMASVPLAQ